MPERAGSDKGALSTVIISARVTLPISESSASIRPIGFRFVRTADGHFDSALATLARRDPTLAEVIGGATRKAFMVALE
jgi:hypothetical protein